MSLSERRPADEPGPALASSTPGDVAVRFGCGGILGALLAWGLILELDAGTLGFAVALASAVVLICGFAGALLGERAIMFLLRVIRLLA